MLFRCNTQLIVEDVVPNLRDEESLTHNVAAIGYSKSYLLHVIPVSNDTTLNGMRECVESLLLNIEGVRRRYYKLYNVFLLLIRVGSIY